MNASFHPVTHLSDEDLLTNLTMLVRRDAQLTAEILAHLAEVDSRRRYLARGTPSLFAYCVEALHFTEDAAFKRIAAARAARCYPLIFQLVANGELYLSTVVLLAPHLCESNHRELCEAARNKSKRAVEQMLAARFPQPDAATLVRKLPDKPATLLPAPAVAPTLPQAPLNSQPAPGVVLDSPATPSWVKSPSGRALGRPPESHLCPLAIDRYRLQVTLSGSTRDKLLRARDLLAHKLSHNDLAAVIDQALTRLCDELESKKRAKLKRRPGKARKTAPGPVAEATTPKAAAADSPPAREANSRHIPRAVRRAVFAREGYQCSFVAQDGRRCSATSRLELHHLEPFALGGPTTSSNLTVRCRGHNLYAAVLDFGLTKIERSIAARQRCR